MKVNVVSESAFTTQGHGVHTAYIETVDALKRYTDITVYTNSRRPVDVQHIHTVGPYAIAKLLFGPGAKVVSAHVTPDSFVGSLIGAKYWYRLAEAYLRWFYGRADCVLAVSGEVAEDLARMGVKAPVQVVPNTIETQPFASSEAKRAQARRKLGIANEAFVVLGSGQVQPRKRIDSFLSCAKELPDITFVWAGGMPFKQLAAEHSAMNDAMEHRPANVTFSGVISREDILSYYHAADVFFLPSIQETFGIVIVEAAAAGLPILLRDLQQYKETFSFGYIGADDTSFARILKRLYRDADYYKTWKSAAKVIAERYNAKSGARKLALAYESVIELKQKAGA